MAYVLPFRNEVRILLKFLKTWPKTAKAVLKAFIKTNSKAEYRVRLIESLNQTCGFHIADVCRAVQIQATMAEEIPATAAVTGLGPNPLKCFVIQVLSTFLGK